MIWLIVLLVVIIIVVVLVIILTRPPEPSGPPIPLTPVIPPGPPVNPMPCLNTSMPVGQYVFIKNRRIVNGQVHYMNVTQNPVNGIYNVILSTEGFRLPSGAANSSFLWLLTNNGVLANLLFQNIAFRVFDTIPYVKAETDRGTPNENYFWTTQNGAILSLNRQWAVVPIGITSYYIAGLQTYNAQNTQQCGWEYEQTNF